VIPARAIASFTPAATFSIMGRRPISSGSNGSLIAKPTVSRGSSVTGAASRGTVAKMVACGESTPSVPPDHTIGTCRTSSIGRVPRATSTSRNARSAMMRV
jgi:hypothetical protein